VSGERITRWVMVAVGGLAVWAARYAFSQGDAVLVAIPSHVLAIKLVGLRLKLVTGVLVVLSLAPTLPTPWG
jgi:hypothetical protein